jgi:hypothetical protein
MQQVAMVMPSSKLAQRFLLLVDVTTHIKKPLDQMTALNIATSDENEYENEDEERAVSLSAPEFMRSNARRGLKFHEEGLSGDGLQPQTVEDARKMAAGNITEAKWRKISPWIARHMVDLEAEGVAEGEITAGVVAHLLWGSGTTKSAATRTMQFAENIVARLDEEEQRAPESPNYVTDNDLLHREHPKYSNSRGYDSTKEGATRTMEHAENVADETRYQR